MQRQLFHHRAGGLLLRGNLFLAAFGQLILNGRHKCFAFFGHSLDVEGLLVHPAARVAFGLSGIDAEHGAEAGLLRVRASEGDNGAVLAAGLIIAVHGIGQEHLVQHRERTRIAGAHAEDHEILVLGAGIDDLAADSLLFQFLRSLHGLVPHQEIGHNGDVAALPADSCLPKRHRIISVRHLPQSAELSRLLALAAVEQLMFKHQHRIVIPNGLFHHSLGIIGRGWTDHLQPRNMNKITLQALGVLCPPVGSSAGRPHHHGYMKLPVGHVAHFGSLVDQLIHHAKQEIPIL